MAVHTVDEALSSFELISGIGAEEDRKACAMTLLAWVAGQEWTDHPVCAHPRIADLVIVANDADTATPESRAQLVRAGQDGVLDTWWVPGIVLAWAQSRTKDEPELSEHDRAVRVMQRVAEWKQNKQKPVLRSAVLRSADLRYADLSYADLSSAVLRSADLSSAVLRSAVLRYADLSYADLSSAVLRSADLSYADLRYADFTGARGTPRSGMPDGWKLDGNGLWVRS